MNKYLKLISISLLALCFFGGNARAQNPTLTPDATFTLKIEAFTLYTGDRGVPVSKGVITYKDKQYPFTVTGLGMGNHFGETTLNAHGVIYSLKDINDMEGSFFQIGGGITPGAGEQVVTFKSNKGVIVLMTGTLNGPLFAPTGGATVKLVK